MDAIIRFSSTEFNLDLFEKLAALLQGKNADITIAVHDKTDNDFRKETNEQYWARLNKSITDIEAGNGVTFSMEELDEFVNK